jgi:hypothetical protein
VTTVCGSACRKKYAWPSKKFAKYGVAEAAILSQNGRCRGTKDLSWRGIGRESGAGQDEPGTSLAIPIQTDLIGHHNRDSSLRIVAWVTIQPGTFELTRASKAFFALCASFRLINSRGRMAGEPPK